MKNEPLAEIVTVLKAALPTDKVSGFKDPKKYIGTEYDFIGLSVPALRQVFKNGFSFDSNPVEKQFKLWEKVWRQSGIYEAMTLSLFFCDKHAKKTDVDLMWNYSKKWTPQIDNWAHSDGLSGLYSYLLENNPELIYPQLLKWNTSKNPWERRQSLVSLIEYAKKRKSFLPVDKIHPLIEKLLSDKHCFVQKGLGWTLREAGNAYPKETWNFLLKHTPKLSAVAFSPATEKLNPQQKEQLKQLRKRAK